MDHLDATCHMETTWRPFVQFLAGPELSEGHLGARSGFWDPRGETLRPPTGGSLRSGPEPPAPPVPGWMESPVPPAKGSVVPPKGCSPDQRPLTLAWRSVGERHCTFPGRTELPGRAEGDHDLSVAQVRVVGTDQVRQEEVEQWRQWQSSGGPCETTVKQLLRLEILEMKVAVRHFGVPGVVGFER